MALPPLEAGAVKATLACVLPAVATGLVGAPGTAALAVPPIIFVQIVPLLTCNSPAVPQLVHQTISPAATGLAMAFLSACVILGGKKPLEVLVTSN